MFRTIPYTIFALIAFAFNSILCRLALRGDTIDAASFTGVRLASGAIVLVILSYLVGKGRNLSGSEGAFYTGENADQETKNTLPGARVSALRGSWTSAICLFSYAICFSLAYINLTAGTGALILFGSVQMTMMIVTVARGERPRLLEWLGLVTAISGFVYLVLPGLESPPLSSSLLMVVAGASWAMYTLRGRASGNPLADTTGNFIRTIPFAAVAVMLFVPNLHLSNRGMLFAILSGAIASGIGYTFWYTALRHHTATRAAVLQLAVPIITATIGILFLAEEWTTRLLIAAILILGGIAITIFGRKR